MGLLSLLLGADLGGGAKKKEKGLQHEKVERPREIGALESSGPIAYDTFATRLIQHTAMKSLYLFA